MTHTSEHCIAATHPALPGHFPGNPVIPGVVLLDEVITAIEDWLPGIRVTGFQAVKFLKPVDPDSRFSVELEQPDSETVHFNIRNAATLLGRGIAKLESTQVSR